MLQKKMSPCHRMRSKNTPMQRSRLGNMIFASRGDGMKPVRVGEKPYIVCIDNHMAVA